MMLFPTSDKFTRTLLANYEDINDGNFSFTLPKDNPQKLRFFFRLKKITLLRQSKTKTVLSRKRHFQRFKILFGCRQSPTKCVIARFHESKKPIKLWRIQIDPTWKEITNRKLNFKLSFKKPYCFFPKFLIKVSFEINVKQGK